MGSSPRDDTDAVFGIPGTAPTPDRASPVTDDSRQAGRAILDTVDPRDRLRSVGKRMADPAEALAQRVAEQVIDLVVQALDVNALMQRVDLNAVLDQVDLNEVLKKVDVPALVERVDIDQILSRVDVGALLDRIDVNALVGRVDVGMLVEQTDLGAVIARSSGGIASETLDAVRSQVVGLDAFVDRWVWRLLRRGAPRPPGPAALMPTPADP
jgi:hypothetical protein